MVDSYMGNDREYFFDKEEGIYQVIGYIHPEDTVYCVKKYEKTQQNDTDSSEFLWESRLNNNHYRRILKHYSAKDVHQIMNSDEKYIKLSKIYGIPMISFPKSEISTYFNPRDGFSTIYQKVLSRDIATLKTLNSNELLALDVCSAIMEQSGIEPEFIGITGSILLKMDHPNSDIDILIYGLSNIRSFFEFAKKVPSGSKGLRKMTLTEMFDKAQELSLKYLIPKEDCIEIIKRKHNMLYYNEKSISIKFCPTESEISNNPFAITRTDGSEFETIKPIRIIAEIMSTEWQHYYPSLIFIKTKKTFEKITEEEPTEKSALPEEPQRSGKEPENLRVNQRRDQQSGTDHDLLRVNQNSIQQDERSNGDIKYPITRLVIYEQDFAGWFEKGDVVEIVGMLQYAYNIPDENAAFPQMHVKNAGQIIVGTKELHKIEYVKKSKI